MDKKNKPFFVSVLLALLVLSSVYMSTMPSVNATTVTIQDKGLRILSDVLNIDTPKYSLTMRECPQDSYLGIPQENTRYYLESNQSSLDMMYTYCNGKLRMIDVLETNGSPITTKSSFNEIELSKNFLANYQTYSGNCFYGELKSMLQSVDKTNSTTTAKNIKLTVTETDTGTTFSWIYSQDGVDASDKCVVLGYKMGTLKLFIDNWDLYTVGNPNINLSKDEAIEIAIENAANYSWQVGADKDAYKIVNFTLAEIATTQLVFCNSLEANKNQHSQDPSMLFPMWRIGIALDKFYPGNVYGIYVDIWADTKEVRHIKEIFSTIDPPTDKVASFNESAIPINIQTTDAAQSTSIILQCAIPILALAAISTIPFWLIKRNKHISKQRSFKLGGLILCFLIVSTMFISLATVSADPRRRSTVWGAESTGQAGRKTQAEIDQQRLTAQHISDYFKNDGYVASNYQGSQGSYRSQIIAQISSNEANYDRVAVIDFDHGVGETRYSLGKGEFHYLFEDNIGMDPNDPNYYDNNYIYDIDVYTNTSLRKTYFALINTCMSANYSTYQLEIPQGSGHYYPVGQGFVNGTHAQSMPFAWTHNLVTDNATTTPPSGYMSANGYTHADSGGHCYMGFPYGSASLSQQVDNAYPNVYYWMWVEDFLYYGLSFEMSVIQALDHASYNKFNCGFGDTTLYTNFVAIWDPLPHQSNCKLVVYGNGNIHLYEYFVHYPYVSSGSAGSGLVSNQNGFTGAQPDASYTRLRAINVNDQATVVGSMGYSGANLANGHIWVYGYSSGYTSRLGVWVSYYSDSGWQSVGNINVSPGGAHWIDCGTYSSNFRYISFVVYRESGGPSSDMYLDNVIVLPPLPNP